MVLYFTLAFLSGPVPEAAADERRPHLLGQPRVGGYLSGISIYRRTDTMRIPGRFVEKVEEGQRLVLPSISSALVRNSADDY